MTANNEIGVLQPIEDIAALCRSRAIVFHTDAAQAAGKVGVDVGASGVDLMSLSGHKIYAPIGVGALYVSEESPVVPEPLFWGGGQEHGLFGPALIAPASLCRRTRRGLRHRARQNLRARWTSRATALTHAFFLEIVSRPRCPDVRVNGDRKRRLPGNLSMTFPGM